jgi:hypothetical protein
LSLGSHLPIVSYASTKYRLQDAILHSRTSATHSGTATRSCASAG